MLLIKQLTEISNISSLPPGTLLQGLVVTSVSTGLVLQILGSFDGTVDQYHLPSLSSKYKVGQKLKARVLYDVVGSSPPQFALSLNPHVIALQPKRRSSEDNQLIQDAFPIGTILESVKVKRVEQERGLVVSVDDSVEGFVHVRQASTTYLKILIVIRFHMFQMIMFLRCRPTRDYGKWIQFIAPV